MTVATPTIRKQQNGVRALKEPSLRLAEYAPPEVLKWRN
jgi:hypothetical protein